MNVPSFTSRFIESLPGDQLVANEPRQVRGALWSKAMPTPVSSPTLLAHSREVAEQLGLTEAQLKDPAFLSILAGNAPAPGVTPFAANYGGHQFGNWAGQLGDGRAIGLGELNGLELQLKGAGPTPYSRRGDGRAVLRSSIREFLCSEAMHHLGVPTTRALSLVLTGDRVMRDMFYDGHPAFEPGAIVCRVAPSFLRFGNFELPTSREDVALLRQLGAFTLQHYFPTFGPPSKEAFSQLLTEVAVRTARLMAHWQAVGFVHGVMNTDNMSILGLTIDYGPYGWVDNFDPSWTPNTTDAEQRRYRYGNQPAIGLWNIERLGIALLPLLEDDEALVEQALLAYQKTFELEGARRYTAKLGVTPRDETVELTYALFSFLSQQETDMTIFFRALGEVVTGAKPLAFPEVLLPAFYSPPTEATLRTGTDWLQLWWQRTREEDAAPSVIAQRMNAVNPKYVLRNYLAQEVIDSAQAGDASGVTQLLEVLRHPFDEQPGQERFAQKRPDWARSKPGCSALSCSS
ncbi:MAG: YdiU family protein [Archangium sp.]|nr:YdiU family protein [Archangium sp.]MDP3154685.1 YdiU family protein [Archangium sp.]MDP3572687.1 YdiU family protein [Archangium sp.]